MFMCCCGAQLGLRRLVVLCVHGCAQLGHAHAERFRDLYRRSTAASSSIGLWALLGGPLAARQSRADLRSASIAFASFTSGGDPGVP
jgi:hypothetical protein